MAKYKGILTLPTDVTTLDLTDDDGNVVELYGTEFPTDWESGESGYEEGCHFDTGTIYFITISEDTGVVITQGTMYGPFDEWYDSGYVTNLSGTPTISWNWGDEIIFDDEYNYFNQDSLKFFNKYRGD